MSSQPVDDDPKVGRHRRRINSLVDRLGEWMATAQETYDDSNFREGMAGDFPLIPGEQYRVPVDHYQEKWSKIRDRSRSRPPSVNSMDEAASPTSPSSPRWGGGSSRLGVPGRQMTLPTSKPIPWGEAGPSSSSGGRVSGENPPTSGPRGRQLHRRDTLEAPPSASRAGRRMVREQFASSSSASSLSPQQLSPRGPNMAAGFRGSQSTQTAPYSPGLAVPVEGEALSLTLPPLGPVSPACPAAAAVGPGPGSSAIVDSPPVTPTAGPSSSSAGPSEAQPAS